MANLVGDSADAVAYQILLGIAYNEKKATNADNVVCADKEWILATLREIYSAMNVLKRP